MSSSNHHLISLKRLFPPRTRRPFPTVGIGSRPITSMDLNFFKFCSGLKVLGYLMIALVAAIIAVSYYSVVVLTWGPLLLHGGFSSFLSFTILALFHFLLILLTWSYFMVVARDPGSVPENWKPALEENLEAGDSAALSDHITPEGSRSTSSLDGQERRPTGGYCRHCRNGKPPRCHHCSICERCVLKMDHHCVWVVNCVGARNYKFFLLFLQIESTESWAQAEHARVVPNVMSGITSSNPICYQLYTFLETILDTLSLLPSFMKFFGEARRHSVSPSNLAATFLAFVLNLAFALSLLCFLVMHASLLLSNTTSIEVYEKKRVVRWKYDLGRKKNFEQVFGSKKALWFFPLLSKEDLEDIPALHGLHFPMRSDADA